MKLKNQFFLLLLLVALATLAVFISSKRRIANDSSCGCTLPSPEATGEFEPGSLQAVFDSQPVDFRIEDLALFQNPLAQTQPMVLGLGSDERWIEVDLSDQKLYAHNGGNIDYAFLVSSGKWGLTPTGDFRIWIKLRYTKMSGGSGRTYYYLPNVPFTQYFYKGYGLHGTYWHNNFGHPMSHGCVNLATPDAEKLFYWTSPPVTEGKNTIYPSKDNAGTRVVVHN